MLVGSFHLLGYTFTLILDSPITDEDCSFLLGVKTYRMPSLFCGVEASVVELGLGFLLFQCKVEQL